MASGLLILDGISLLYILSVLVMGLIIMGIIVQRQISRNRLNSARRDPQVNFKDLGRRQRQSIEKNLEIVRTIREGNAPKLTDCTTISEHSNAPYLHRMIAVDEVSHEIESQMERISIDYKRKPGETTLQYLMRLRGSYPSIPLTLIHRIAFLYECARYRYQKFDMVERMELKSLLSQFMKIVADSQVRAGGGRDETIGSGKQRRRDRFGGSDGVRLLMGSSFLSSSHSSGEDRLRVIAAHSPFHRRRKSDTNFNEH
ncbi:hypothetical protein PFISCL1PPCAC_20407 [Pristionchus fissidentatus]|uniref:Uncharacterized protein n=1 Tax=Pristionchus fissidentatus TaxID=1538716 RepID=A0AAV5WEQ3_9BILA|nr:hypothetical protein PFISCL1PPCAC_20407 [Pristionchus fissidentatus]